MPKKRKPSKRKPSKRKPNIAKIVGVVIGLLVVSAMVLGPLLSFLVD